MSNGSSLGSDSEVVVAGSAGIGEDYTHYVPAHSDYLIHWTGRDIDDQHDPNWYKDHSSTTESAVTGLYLDRLKAILKHGLWMMDDNETIKIAGVEYARPNHCRTCFTELKLSTTRGHARRYGRLGIGFKRFFLFNRLGGPMSYYHESKRNWFTPALWAGQPTSYDEFFACFLKPMTEKTPDSTMKYSFYDESEWRIIYSDEVEQRLVNYKTMNAVNWIVPASKFSSELCQYVSGLQPKPTAVIPINDEWFAMIIYPSLAAKVASEADPEIRSLINAIKPCIPPSAPYGKENPSGLEKNSKPIELDLDACRNF